MRVNLVQVRVVVRDQHDRPVADLDREDFKLFDQGKLQAISTFAVGTPETRRARTEAAKHQAATDNNSSEASTVMPDRFVALVFDDMHMAMEDTANVHTVVGGFVSSLSAFERLAIFSTSGSVNQEFTSDQAALQHAALGIAPRSLQTRGISTCPEMTYYLADQIINKQNADALHFAKSSGDPKTLRWLRATAQSIYLQGTERGLPTI